MTSHSCRRTCPSPSGAREEKTRVAADKAAEALDRKPKAPELPTPEMLALGVPAWSEDERATARNLTFSHQRS